MKGLLTGAAFNTHYNEHSHVDRRNFLSDCLDALFLKFEQLCDAWKDNDDWIPLIGFTLGMGFGIILVFTLLRFFMNTSVSKEKKEAFNFLSTISRGHDDVNKYDRPKSRKKKNGSSWIQWIFGSPSRSSSAVSITTFPKSPACYLVYESEQGGRLVQWFSKTPLNPEENSVLAFWKTHSHISALKFQESGGRTTLVINCGLGFQGRHKYCNGVCQFIKGAFAHGEFSITVMPNLMKGKKTFSDDDEKAKQLMPIDIYVYQHDNRPSHQTLQLRPLKAMPIPSSHSLKAIACLPHKTSFYKKLGVELSQWMADGERYGSSIHI